VNKKSWNVGALFVDFGFPLHLSQVFEELLPVIVALMVPYSEHLLLNIQI